MRGETGAGRSAPVESERMQTGARRASWGMTIAYGTVVGVLWTANVMAFDPQLQELLPYTFPAAIAAAIACEQGVARLSGANLLLAIAMVPGVAGALIAGRAPLPLMVLAFFVGPVVVARCLADMFLRAAGASKRRVFTALAVPLLIAIAGLVATGGPPPRHDRRFILLTAVLGLAAIPPAPRKREAA